MWSEVGRPEAEEKKAEKALQDLETLTNVYIGSLFFRPVCRQAGSRLRSSLPRGRRASFETKIFIKITIEPFQLTNTTPHPKLWI